MQSFNFSELNHTQAYKLLIGTVLPRPIAWISTVDAAGVPNLAPFSFFNVVSVNPPILMFAPLMLPLSETEVKPKDTLLNIRETGECVIHVAPYALRKEMSHTSHDWEQKVNEFEKAKLTAVPSQLVKPPRVAEAPVAIECSLEQIISYGEQPRAGSLVLVKVLCMHTQEGLVEDFKVNLEILDPIARLGGPFYSRAKAEVFAEERL